MNALLWIKEEKLLEGMMKIVRVDG